MTTTISETEPSEIRLGPAPGARYDLDSGLMFTAIPWHAGHDGAKVPSLPAGFHYRDFAYGRPAVPWSQWVPNDQTGYVTSFESGVIVIDIDKPGAVEWLESLGIDLPETAEVSSGRHGGRHLVFDGRHLSRDQWPKQRNYLGLVDIKSHGFVAAPGAFHPSGRRYKLTRAMSPAPWNPEWTRLLDEAWAAMDRGTGGSYERAVGWGRNCELYEYKRTLFFGCGLDEDDPELARRIFARNQLFDPPLSKAEIRDTILQHKGWKRRLPLAVMRDAAEERLGDAELQEYKARMAEAFGQAEGAQDGSAGQGGKQFGRPRAEVRQLGMAEPESEPPATQGVVAPTEEGSSSSGATTGFPDGSRRACEDLIRDPVLVRELLRDSWDETGRKLGEGNDWDGSPRLCHEAYDHHLLRWADGADIRVADMEPAHVRWLERPGLFVGSRVKPKYVQFIRLEGDLVVPQDTALKDPGPEYPGWDDETQRPCEGRRCGWRTRAAVLEAVQSGKAVDRPAICELLNTKACREANPELDLCGCKGFKRKQIDKCVERLIHDGELYVVEEAVQYWRNRCWNTVPAVLAVPEVPEEPPAAPELDGEDEPTENNRIVAVWYRQHVKKFCRAARNKRGRQQERGTPQGEGTGRPAMQGRERDPVQCSQERHHRRPASP